jgi:hypothetical protein
LRLWGENKADRIRSCIVLDWDYAFNYDKHILGRKVGFVGRSLILKWLFLIRVSKALIVSLNLLRTTLASFILLPMGHNKGVDRKLLWINLGSMKVKVANNPWMICGDFNVVKSLSLASA